MSGNEFIIYGDGACSGNPGPGGYGAIVLFPDRSVIELADQASQTTNNRMEILAVLDSFLLILKSPLLASAQRIQVFTDSVYLIRGATQWMFGWKKKGWKSATNEMIANPDLWKRMDLTLNSLKQKNSELKIEWNFVKGHSGILGNERCDQIAVAMSKNDGVDLYSGPVERYFFDLLQLPEKKPLPEMNKNRGLGPTKNFWYLSLVNGVVSLHKTWSECEAIVKGRPGVKFKKVSSSEEEAQVKKQWGI